MKIDTSRRLNRADLTQNIQIAHIHNLYILKRKCIKIIQFIELYTKYRLFDMYQSHGVYEDLEWESMIINYLELVHLCQEKQRKIYKGVCKFKGANYDEERKSIIFPVSEEHAIIIALRNSIHHSTFTVVRISQASDENNKSIPSPNINWPQIELNEKQQIFVRENLFLGGDKLSNLFKKHCDIFMKTSRELGDLLLKKLDDN